MDFGFTDGIKRACGHNKFGIFGCERHLIESNQKSGGKVSKTKQMWCPGTKSARTDEPGSYNARNVGDKVGILERVVSAGVALGPGTLNQSSITRGVGIWIFVGSIASSNEWFVVQRTGSSADRDLDVAAGDVKLE